MRTIGAAPDRTAGMCLRYGDGEIDIGPWGDSGQSQPSTGGISAVDSCLPQQPLPVTVCHWSPSNAQQADDRIAGGGVREAPWDLGMLSTSLASKLHASFKCSWP